ncbi:MAG: Hsp20/alpha crystallin family protein [Proteobacteria bacterium]|nr:Hsp20/alpha crystallin family protein [Pseudomonadota bacterium]
MLFAPAAALRRTVSTPSFDRFFEQALSGARPFGASFAQDEKSVTLSFDLPGVTKEQLAIGIEGNLVRIESTEGAPRRYKLAYELPQDIDVAASDAKLENGVLTLKLAKQVPPSRVTQLAIN